MTPLTIVTWKWTTPGYRSTFGPDTVTILRDMIARHYQKPFRMICVTNEATGIDPAIEIVPDLHDFAGVPSPHGGKNPSCYRRLRMYRPDIAEVFGPRFVSMDLDCTVTGDLTPLLDRTEDIILWGDTNPRTHYNGSFTLMKAGARPQVWDRFDPLKSPRMSMQAGCFGSDQGWISHCLGAGETKWTKADGVYSFRNDLKAFKQKPLPTNCRIVFWHGTYDPWSQYARDYYPWVETHYRRAELPVEVCR